MDGYEFLQTSQPPEPQHRPFASSEGLVRILGAIVGPAASSLVVMDTKLLECGTVRSKAIRYEFLGATVPLQRFLQEFQSCLLVACLCHEAFEHLSFGVDGSPKIVLLAVDLYEHLVQRQRLDRAQETRRFWISGANIGPNWFHQNRTVLCGLAHASGTTPWSHTRNSCRFVQQSRLRIPKYLGRKIWRRWSGYHRPSRAETKMHCVKLPGQRLRARDFDRQVAEFQIRVAVLNGLTKLGILSRRSRCRSVREKRSSGCQPIGATEPGQCLLYARDGRKSVAGLYRISECFLAPFTSVRRARYERPDKKFCFD